VTSLLAEAEHPWSGHGDGLAAFRGTVAHRAVELTYGAKACPPLGHRDKSGGWHVVDFKTDVVEGRSPAAAAEPYLAQLGLYGLALERAVGEQPFLELCFLRTGGLYRAAWSDVESSLAAARARVGGAGHRPAASRPRLGPGASGRRSS